MYVLCTLAVLALHSLLKNRSHKIGEPGGTSEKQKQHPPEEDGGGGIGEEARPCGGGLEHPMSCCRGEGKRKRGGGCGGVRNIPDSRKRVQVRRWRQGFIFDLWSKTAAER